MFTKIWAQFWLKYWELPNRLKNVENQFFGEAGRLKRLLDELDKNDNEFTKASIEECREDLVDIDKRYAMIKSSIDNMSIFD